MADHVFDGFALVVHVEFAHAGVDLPHGRFVAVFVELADQVVHLRGRLGERGVDFLQQGRFLGPFDLKRSGGRHADVHAVGRKQDHRSHGRFTQIQVVEVRFVAGELHLVGEVAGGVGPDGIDGHQAIEVEFLEHDGGILGVFHRAGNAGHGRLFTGGQQQKGQGPDGPFFHTLMLGLSRIRRGWPRRFQRNGRG